MTGDIGIRELKAHLSEVIARVAAGERVRITDRGKPRVLLVPLPGVDRRAAGAAEGWITPRSSEGNPFRLERTLYTPIPGGRTSAEIIDEDRGE